MTFEISQRFFFDAAHTLQRKIETEGSARIHGHTYHAEVSLRGVCVASTGMVEDLGRLRANIDRVKNTLDHQFLDEIQVLGPPTLENLCTFIVKQLQECHPTICAVRVWRDGAGDGCLLRIG